MGRIREGAIQTRHRAREGAKLQYRHRVSHFTLTHHPVPVRSLLNDGLSPDGNIIGENGENSEIFLGLGFQIRLAARQMIKRALHLFHYVWGDAALGGRVDGEYASVCTASHVPVHPASAFVDGSLQDFYFPTVQKRGVEVIPCGIAVGEHERLLGVQGLFREGVEFGGVPVNLDLDLGKGDRVRRICTLSVDREVDVGLMVIGVRVLSVPTTRERNLGPESARTLTSWKGIMTRGLGQWVEAKEGFI